MKITISAGNVSLPAELNDSPTAQQIIAALPTGGQYSVIGNHR